MPLGKWTKRVNGVDTIWAEDINAIAGAVIELEEQAKEQEPVNDNPVFTGKLTVDGIEIYKENNSEGWVVIRRPMSISGVAPVPESHLKLGYNSVFLDDFQIYHEGNLKNLAQSGNLLSAEEQGHFRYNTGLEKILSENDAEFGEIWTAIGAIDTALDDIIEIQNTLIGGDV